MCMVSCAKYHTNKVGSNIDLESLSADERRIDMMREIVEIQNEIESLVKRLKEVVGSEKMEKAVREARYKAVSGNKQSVHTEQMGHVLKKELDLKEAELRALRRLWISEGNGGL